jgi:hypothetical protein
MSVEYGLMLVLVMGLVSTGLGFALKDNFGHFTCLFNAAMNDSTCPGSGDQEGQGGEENNDSQVGHSGENPACPLAAADSDASPSPSPTADATPDATPSPCPTADTAGAAGN